MVSTSFDPMLGKIIVHGSDREAARTGLVRALDQATIFGLTTNIGFLRALAAGDEFRDATIDTAWLDRNQVPTPDPTVARLFAAWATAPDVGGGPTRLDGWRDGARPAPITVELDQNVVVDRAAGTVDGVRVVESHSHGDRVTGRRTVLAIDGVRHGATTAVTSHRAEVVHRGQRHVFVRPDVFADQGPAVGDGSILAPMPGTVLVVNVAEGDTVAEGDVLGVMEAMKMELALKSPFAGTVVGVHRALGNQVALGDLLFEVTEDEE